MAVEAPPAPASIPAAAPAPPVAPTGQSKAPALPNAPKIEIAVSKMSPPAEPAAPPKKGSAKEGLFKSLREKAQQEPGTFRDPPAAPAAPEADPELEAGDEPEPTADPAKDPATEPKKKVSPWKLVEEYKQKLAQAEADKLEIEKRAIPDAKWKEKEAEVEATKTRLQELEEEIKFVNYSKSEEFKTKHQVPYEEAWSRAMSELSELTVIENNEERPLSANDILELVNLPLQKAHMVAREKFGDLAGDVLAHRKEIRNLFDQQNKALTDARKISVDREKTMAEASKKMFGEMADHVRQTWSKANEEILADPKVGKFFTTIEGDAEINQRLAKGFEMADRAFSENPMNAKTPEERAAIVKRHAAVRNRAAAFGRLVYENEKAAAKIAALEKTLSEYKQGEPETKGSTPEAKKNGVKGIDGVLGELRKRAKQV